MRLPYPKIQRDAPCAVDVEAYRCMVKICDQIDAKSGKCGGETRDTLAERENK